MSALRIAAVDCALVPALRGLGHEVLDLRPGPGMHCLPELLDRHGFTPDLLIHQEVLGKRRFLSGLGELACTKIFWSIDTHLNAWWHCLYGRFFDCVATTQDHWLPRLESLGLESTAWLPWFGRKQPFAPHATRQVPVGFVGRLTVQRQVRRWLAEFLRRRLPFVLKQDVPEKELPEAYARIRLVPNETILGELNFRIFEAASAGCAVFTPRIKAGQDRLFSVGREIMVHDDALELLELLEHYLAHPEQAEEMGRRAHARVQAEHLPEHRAARVVDMARTVGPCRADGTDGHWTAMLQELHESGMLRVDPRLLDAGLGGMWSDPEAAARHLRFIAASRQDDRLGRVLVTAAKDGVHAGSLRFNLTASMAALRLEHMDLAKAFWYRAIDGRSHAWSRPESPAHLLVLWAEELARQGLAVRPGFPFDPGRHLPATALECLVWAGNLVGPGEDLSRRMNGLLRDMEGGEHLRLGVLSDLSLRRKRDWRVGLELGLLNIRCFRVDAGMEEIIQARLLAAEQGREQSFRRMLAARDAGGRVTEALEIALCI